MPSTKYLEWVSPEKITRTGERIVDDLDRGETGWLDWTNDYQANPGVRTARLFKERGSDIDVDEAYWGQGVGRDLFSYVIERVKDNNFDQLLVLGAHENG